MRIICAICEIFASFSLMLNIQKMGTIHKEQFTLNIENGDGDVKLSRVLS